MADTHEQEPLFVSRDLQMMLEDQELELIRAEHKDYTAEEVDRELFEWRKGFRTIGHTTLEVLDGA